MRHAAREREFETGRNESFSFIVRACEEPNLRLELRFRPEDAFCKPTCGERTRETGFLLKVKKMRRKKGREKEGKDYK